MRFSYVGTLYIQHFKNIFKPNQQYYNVILKYALLIFKSVISKQYNYMTKQTPYYRQQAVFCSIKLRIRSMRNTFLTPQLYYYYSGNGCYMRMRIIIFCTIQYTKQNDIIGILRYMKVLLDSSRIWPVYYYDLRRQVKYVLYYNGCYVSPIRTCKIQPRLFRRLKRQRIRVNNTSSCILYIIVNN